jgi:hypothetical protein
MAKARRGRTEPTLFGDRIERLPSVVDLGPVPVRNSCDAAYATDGERRWVRKPLMGADGLLAEALGFMLGRELLAPIPDGAVTGPTDDLAWLSEVIPNIQHWDSQYVNFIINFPEVGRLMALDAILLNDDRHAGNLVLQATATNEFERKAWGIDMGNALAGRPSDYAKAGLSTPSIAKLVDKLPVALIAEGALLAATQAQELSKFVVVSMVREACELAHEPRENEDLLSAALQARLARAPDLVEEYLSKIGARP